MMRNDTGSGTPPSPNFRTTPTERHLAPPNLTCTKPAYTAVLRWKSGKNSATTVDTQSFCQMRFTSTLHGMTHLLKNTKRISNTSCCLDDSTDQVFLRRRFLLESVLKLLQKKSMGDRSGDGHPTGPP
ncbi:hypothetical protein AVEN_45023-1 [Araneus ventricosus]|uniref:Uncharacterized protein n=1 Tax=Araneus ventricosus TaxID=182803 RepID=A0A4Y2I7F8_ARAVE|nr:hypothetical protein AVEN_45023-1 [Araneus ventricosus]